ncbi:major capsid protein [Delftia tsuruhatensis]|uniref:major capsid protein n=1 Tax=Delftia tsuruhatensis TaxID=180282 RepID=UPI00062D2BBF|nr:major capsid protein [Delftia tsuruhatensis]
MQPNLSDVRVIDPILTEVARGYGSPNAKIASILFPIVSVKQRGGTILTFGPESFRLVNTARAPGANTKRIQLGYAKGEYSLVDHRLEGEVPLENGDEAQTVPGIDLGAMAVNTVQDVMANEREKLAADLARNPANYPTENKAALSGTSKWTDPNSNPAEDINDAKEVIRKKIGKKPNVMTVGPKVLSALRNHPKILDRISVTVDRVPATIDQLQRLLEIDRIVEGEATYYDGNGFQDMWGLDAILAFTTPASMQQRGSPNYGYTYQLQDRPQVEEPYFEKNPQTWYYPVSDAYRPVLVGATAGFLFQGAAA